MAIGGKEKKKRSNFTWAELRETESHCVFPTCGKPRRRAAPRSIKWIPDHDRYGQVTRFSQSLALVELAPS